MYEMTVATTSQLREMHDAALASERPNTLSDELLAQLDADGLHLVLGAHAAGERWMTAALMVKVAGSDEPVEVTLDARADQLAVLIPYGTALNG